MKSNKQLLKEVRSIVYDEEMQDSEKITALWSLLAEEAK